jgi:excinuclease ABC subunit A
LLSIFFNGVTIAKYLGAEGGEIIAMGTPEQIAKIEESQTGRFLKPHLERG